MSTDRMSCGEAREKLPLYVGGDLDHEVLDAVHGHLESCASCAIHADEAQRARRELVAALRTRASEAVRPDLWSGLRTTLRAEGLVHAAPQPRALARAAASASRGNVHRWTWALVPAAAAAILVAVLQLGGDPTGGIKGGIEKNRPAVPVLVERASPLPEVETVSNPTGGLMPMSAEEASQRRLPAPYRREPRYGEQIAPSGDGISLSGFK